MQKYFDTILGSNGAIIKGGSVSIFAYGGTTLSSLFSDSAGTIAKDNPLTTDSLGYFEFYAANGRYSMLVTADGFVAKNVSDVQQEDPNDLAVYLAAANAAIAVQVAAATTQATNASTSATNALSSASSASGNASTASTQATAAAASATAASSSATSASGSASTATTQASNASASASTATTQATNASNSATSASTSASTASTQASNALTSANNAAASAASIAGGPVASVAGLTGTVTSAALKTATALNNVDNTLDVNKPVSTAQQTALNLKAPLASPTFTGTVAGITSAMVGLGNVDNTSNATERAAVATLTNKSISGGQITSAVANATLASTVTTNANLTGDVTSAGNATTLSNTAVTPGSYTSSNITVDAKGRITAATSGASGGVTSFSGSTTGLTPNTATTGAITLAGTLAAANGGTGLATPSTTGNVLTSTGSGWVSSAPAGGGATGGGTNKAFVENDNYITANYTIGAGAQSTATISIATPAVVTQANTFIAGQPVRFTTTGALPTGLSANAVYYVSATGLTTSSYQVSATSGGASVNTSGTQSGTQTAGIIKNASQVGVITIASGVVITVPTGSRLVVN